MGTTLVKAQQLLEVRTALTQACAHAGLPVPGFDANLAAGKPIKAIHINELRSALWTVTGGTPPYSSGPANAAMAAGALTIGGGAMGPAGGSQPHNNLQPYLAMNYCISLFGIFPSPA